MSTTDELHWFKSSYSGSEGDSCVEVAVQWRKSSYSGPQGDDCVEVAQRPGAVHVHDSKDKNGPRFAVAPSTRAGFIGFAAR
jgi:hypothetical protein